MAAQTSASEDEEDDASAAPSAAPGAPPAMPASTAALCPYNARRCGACGRGVRSRPPRGPSGGRRRRRTARRRRRRRGARRRAGPGRVSPVGAFGARGRRAPGALRCEQLHRALRQLVQRLMQLPLSQNVQRPVDRPAGPAGLLRHRPRAHGPRHGQVAARGVRGQRRAALAADVRRVFDNAQRYNRRATPCTARRRSSRATDADLERALERARARARQHGTRAASAAGGAALCGKRIRSAPALICSGRASSACAATSSTTRRATDRLWCHKCAWASRRSSRRRRRARATRGPAAAHALTRASGTSAT